MVRLPSELRACLPKPSLSARWISSYHLVATHYFLLDDALGSSWKLILFLYTIEFPNPNHHSIPIPSYQAELNTHTRDFCLIATFVFDTPIVTHPSWRMSTDLPTSLRKSETSTRNSSSMASLALYVAVTILICYRNLHRLLAGQGSFEQTN